MRARILESEYRKWWTLGAVAFALFMIMLDNTVVNVALPSIQRSLDAEPLGTRVGRQRLRAHVRRAHAHRRQARRPARQAPDLPLGLVVFTGASLACGLAESTGQLIAFRAAAGSRRGAHDARHPRDHLRGLSRRGSGGLLSASGPASPRWRSPSGHWSAASSPSTSTGAGSSSSTSRSECSALSSAWIVIAESRDTSSEQSLDLPGLLVSAGARCSH